MDFRNLNKERKTLRKLKVLYISVCAILLYDGNAVGLFIPAPPQTLSNALHYDNH